jgi:hypothetical protein
MSRDNFVDTMTRRQAGRRKNCGLLPGKASRFFVCLSAFRPCHGSGGYSPVSGDGGPISVPVQSMWDMCYAKRHWDRIFLRMLWFFHVSIIPPMLYSFVHLLPVLCNLNNWQRLEGTYLRKRTMWPDWFWVPPRLLLCKIRRPENEVDHSSSSIDMRTEWTYTCTTAYVFMTCAWTTLLSIENKREVQLDARKELCKSVRRERECIQWTFLEGTARNRIFPLQAGSFLYGYFKFGFPRFQIPGTVKRFC